jgi:GTP cyclohydrolase II
MKASTSKKYTAVPADAKLPTKYGEFRIRSYVDPRDGAEHAAIYYGDMNEQAPPLVRVHSECLTGDALGSLRCDCGPQLQHALKTIQKAGRGVVLYLRQEGRGIGLFAKMQAYNLQDRGLDTLDANLALNLPADGRDYKIAAHMLNDIGIDSIRLMTNNPDKVEQLSRHGINVVDRVEHRAGICTENIEYLQTKVARMRHILPF